MHRPPAFREDRIEVRHAAIRAHPLATLVTGGPAGLEANHIPFLIEEDGSFGVLRARSDADREGVAAGLGVDLMAELVRPG